MYYEERIIKGILHYRNLPDGKWCQMSKKELTQKIIDTYNEMEELKRELIEVSEDMY